MRKQIVLDTNVFIAALRSRKGASFRLLSLIGKGEFDINVSVPLILEYEEAAKNMVRELELTHADIDDIIDYVCKVANRRQLFFLWRPFLRDPHDDLVLELAVEASCDYIVTHNTRDFEGVGVFGVRAITPREFLKLIGGPQ